MKDLFLLVFYFFPLLGLTVHFLILAASCFERQARGRAALMLAAALGWWPATLAASAPLWLGCLAGGCADKPLSWLEVTFNLLYTAIAIAIFVVTQRWHERWKAHEAK